MPMGCVACVLLIQRNTSPKGSETGRKIGEKNGDARFFCTNCERPEGTAFRIVHPNRPKTESPDFATGSALFRRSCSGGQVRVAWRWGKYRGEMMIAIDHIAIPAGDVGASARFLSEIFGVADATPRGPEGDMRWLDIGEAGALLFTPAETVASQHVAFRV